MIGILLKQLEGCCCAWCGSCRLIDRHIRTSPFRGHEVRQDDVLMQALKPTMSRQTGIGSMYMNPVALKLERTLAFTTWSILQSSGHSVSLLVEQRRNHKFRGLRNSSPQASTSLNTYIHGSSLRRRTSFPEKMEMECIVW
jgi:hypothetical protein